MGVSAVAAVMALSLAATPAFAQASAESRATARALGEQGQTALDAKDYKKAEDDFRRAEGLFHAPTLLLGLARASAGEGKFVEAWEAYNRIILEANTSTPAFSAALDSAKQEIGTVENRRSRVVITVTGPDAPHATLDDTAVSGDALGVAMFLNPGSHTVKVAADGFNPASQTFTVAEGATANVSVPMTKNPSVHVAPLPGAHGNDTTPTSTWSTQKTLAVVAGGVGVVGVALGSVFGLIASSQASTAKNECMPGTCTPDGHAAALSDHDSAATSGNVSTVAFIVGGVGLATGIVLWFTAPRAKEAPPPTAAFAITGLRLDPVVSARGSAMMLSGSFQ
jgi:hypothetical protein